VKRYRITWWQGGPPGTPQAVERTASVWAAYRHEALLALHAECAAAGIIAYAPVAEAIPDHPTDEPDPAQLEELARRLEATGWRPDDPDAFERAMAELHGDARLVVPIVPLVGLSDAEVIEVLRLSALDPAEGRADA